MPSWSERDEAGRELERRLGIRAERDASLAEHTTMRVGGPADLLATIRDHFALRGTVRLAQSRGWPLTILGRGSNVVISDAGIRGLVILNRSGGATVDAATGVLSADSGLSMAKLSTLAADAGLTGAEFTLAIPATLAAQSGRVPAHTAVRLRRSLEASRSCVPMGVKRSCHVRRWSFRTEARDSRARLVAAR